MPDPGDPQALNRYSYTLNNPIRYTDPSGHAFASPEGGASGAIAVAAGYALASQAGQALNIAVADGQAFLQSLGQQLGNLMPAVTDQFANPGQASASASSNAGNTAGPGGLGPNDPWDKFNSLLGQSKSEIDAAVEASTQGSGDRFVIGKYVSPEEFQRTGQVGYIQEVQARGGRYFDAGKTLWARLDQSGMAGEVNRQVIRRQMEGGINRIELAGETIQQALSRKGSWTVEEIKWIREFAKVFGYVEDATGWTKGP